MATSKRKHPPYRQLFSHLERMNTWQRLVVACYLSELVNGQRIAAVIDEIALKHRACPRCHARSFNRHGVANGLHRYRCRDCGRTFNGLSGTPLARLRLKGKWLAYCECLRDPSCTVKSAAAAVGVHANTSFRWRHRFLQWTKLDRPRCLEGVAEAAETYLMESQKGAKSLKRPARKRGGLAHRRGFSNALVNIVITRDRGGGTVDFIGGRGALQARSLHAQLLPKLLPDILLVSNSNKAYQAFANQAGIDHQPINARQVKTARNAIHLHNVDAYHGRFTQWLAHFHGVATRYLENYLGWRWAIDFDRIGSAEQLFRAALGNFHS